MEGRIDWRPYIHSDPKILLGEPVIRGTRLAVDFLLDLLAIGWTEQALLEELPTLTPEGLRAALAFAAARLRDEAPAATLAEAA
jgi:uncharacterized protein (DUF433 family)